MAKLVGSAIVLKRSVPVDRMLAPLARDQARIYLWLLLYGTIGALEEDLIPRALADQVILGNADVLSYCRDGLKDPALTDVLSQAMQANDDAAATASRGAEESIRRSCFRTRWAEMKARLLQDEYPHSLADTVLASPGMVTRLDPNIVVRTLLPIDKMIGSLPPEEARIFLSVLLYGTFSALEEGLIPCRLADQAVLCNSDVLSYCEDKLKDAVLTDVMEHAIQAGDYLHVLESYGVVEKIEQVRFKEHCAMIKAKLVQYTDDDDMTAVPESPVVETCGLPSAIVPFGAEQARAYQIRTAEFLGVPVEEAIEIEDGVTLELILIPAGEFKMGSPLKDRKRSFNEQPHRVRLTKAFYCGKFPVTRGQWEAVMGENPKRLPNAGKAVPIERVSWDDCQVFAQKLCTMQGVPEGTYRLLTEAEWEYACRAGSSTRYCFGDDVCDLDAYAWYDDNCDDQSRTQPVGQKQPNAFGLYDVHGNVWEWCQDRYDPVYPSDPVMDPLRPQSGERRVLRGGSCGDWAETCRSASRDECSPGQRCSLLGLRLARTILSLPQQSGPTADPS